MDDNKSTSSKLSKRFKIKKPEQSSSKISLEVEKIKQDAEKIQKDSEKLAQGSKSSLKESKPKKADDEKKFLKFKKSSPTSSATSLKADNLNKSSSETIFDRSTKPNISSMNADDSLVFGIDRLICLWNYIQRSINKKNT